MGTSLIVVLEYDDSESDTVDGLGNEPFSGPVEGAVDLSDFDELRFGKDYRFIGAISGFRSAGDFTPLFTLRGLPENVSCNSSRHFSEAGCSVGWLRYSELMRSLEHASIDPKDLSLPVQIVMVIMRFLSRKLGDRRVRMVFEVYG